MIANKIKLIVADIIAQPSIYGLPKLRSASVAFGGVAHYVFRLESDSNAFYLKIRDDHFPNIPSIKIDPADIAYEFKALSLLHVLLPDNFPEVVYFDPVRAFIVETSVNPDGKTLQQLFYEHIIDHNISCTFGETLRRVHDATKPITDPIRGNKEEAFFVTKLQHRFGYRHNHVLSEMIHELTHNHPRQLIIGDPSPKNVAIGSDGKHLVFFDLEDVHQGCAVFDVGFVLGHLILHCCDSAVNAIMAVNGFLESYGVKDCDLRILRILALGTILYRLDSIIPYPIDLSNQEKTNLKKNVELVLADSLIEDNSWHDLVNRILVKTSS